MEFFLRTEEIPPAPIVTGGMVRRTFDQNGEKKGGGGDFSDYGTSSPAALLFPPLSIRAHHSAANAVSERNPLRKAFLVATKDEPVQDRRTNTEKIMSAGFDTKTSFRNVK